MKELHNLRLTGLTHLEAGQFVKRNLADLTAANVNTATDVHIKNYITQMQTDSALFDKALLQLQKNEETDELAALDHERDMSYMFMYRQFKVYELSKVPAELAAYKSLKIVFSKYKKVTIMNYEAETNAISNLLQDLAIPKYAAHVLTLKLTPHISRLKTDNDNFNARFTTRSTGTAATVVYDAKAIRKTMIANYSNYANYVLLLAQSVNTPYYNGILAIVNNDRKYYSDLLAIRAGIKDSHAPTPPSDN